MHGGCFFEQWTVLFEATNRRGDNLSRLEKFCVLSGSVDSPHLFQGRCSSLILYFNVFNGRHLELRRLELRYYGLWPSGAASNA